ncbi:MAG: NAD(P)-dependent oxidoreductase, partial [Treponemataceae bacterium]
MMAKKTPMLVLENHNYNRAKKSFDDSGLLREVVADLGWPRMLELQAKEGIDAFIISHERFPDEFYRKLKKGSLLIRYGVGYDAVPIALCKELGILVANTPGTLDQSVAEHAMTLIAALARRLIIQDADVKAGRWAPVMAEELSGKTLAIIGFGSIGRTLARIAKLGFGMKISAFDINEKVRDAFPDLLDEFTTKFEDAVRGADYVSLHMNLNP